MRAGHNYYLLFLNVNYGFVTSGLCVDLDVTAAVPTSFVADFSR